MYRSETYRRIELALGQVLAQTDIRANLTDSQKAAELIAEKLSDQLWLQGYELGPRPELGAASGTQGRNARS